MMAENQPPKNANPAKQEATKPAPAETKPEQRAKVDAKTAAKNRSSFFKNS
jgi:hypothetical protein